MTCRIVKSLALVAILLIGWMVGIATALTSSGLVHALPLVVAGLLLSGGLVALFPRKYE